MGHMQRAAGLSGTADDALGDAASARCQQHNVAACCCEQNALLAADTSCACVKSINAGLELRADVPIINGSDERD